MMITTKELKEKASDLLGRRVVVKFNVYNLDGSFDREKTLEGTLTGVSLKALQLDTDRWYAFKHLNSLEAV